MATNIGGQYSDTFAVPSDRIGVAMLSAEHGLPLLVIGAVIAAVLIGARSRPGRWVEHGARAIAVAVVVAEICWWGITIVDGTWTVRYNLPLHLCEAGCFLVPAALWWRGGVAFAVSALWGLRAAPR